ncbi:MAG: hypothetical protein AB1442_14945 [Nitrospirota bacterium]
MFKTYYSDHVYGFGRFFAIIATTTREGGVTAEIYLFASDVEKAKQLKIRTLLDQGKYFLFEKNDLAEANRVLGELVRLAPNNAEFNKYALKAARFEFN